VIGVNSDQARQTLEHLYQPILEQKFDCPVHKSCPPGPKPRFLVTSIPAAELIKHASNSFLAMKISYVNALADLCEIFGADVTMVAEGVGSDRRIGRDFLRAGIGFGGFCLPKDIQAFIRLAERGGYDFALLREVEKINQRRIDRFLEKLRNALWVIADKQIAVLGLAFKPETDDIRFSPALAVVDRLLEQKARVKAYDPQAMDKARSIYPQIVCCRNAYEAAQGSDALLLATEWEEFRSLDWSRIHSSMARPLILDGRNFLEPKEMAAVGFEYYSIGRPEPR
jgi:UDPglucose 6-dehydrogenase